MKAFTVAESFHSVAESFHSLAWQNLVALDGRAEEGGHNTQVTTHENEPHKALGFRSGIGTWVWARSDLRVARRVAPSPRSGALRCGRFAAGTVDFKAQNAEIFSRYARFQQRLPLGRRLDDVPRATHVSMRYPHKNSFSKRSRSNTAMAHFNRAQQNITHTKASPPPPCIAIGFPVLSTDRK